MGLIDRLKELRQQRDAISRQLWTDDGASPRAFIESGGRTTEYDIDKNLVQQAMGVVEHHNSSNITYCASYIVGAAVKSCVLRYLDGEIKRLTIEGQKELEEARKILAAGGGT